MDQMTSFQQEKKKWEESMSIGNEDTLLAILAGEKVDFGKKDYLATEPEDHHMDEDFLLEKFASIDGVKVARREFSEDQIKAIDKYPSLIDMLGSIEEPEFSEKIAQTINDWIVEKIAKNSSLINKNAVECKQEGGTLKQYFKYDDKAGFVKASGCFTGNEFIHHTDKGSMILLREGKTEFKNISDKFEIESHFVEIES